MTAAEIAAVVHELGAVLPGARVRDVRQRGDSDLILTLRMKGQNLHLLLSAHPLCSRIYGLSARPAGPWKTTAFRDACRHDLLGSRIEAVEADPGERCVTLTTVRGGTPEALQRRTLQAELHGRFSNLILVEKTGAIREVLRSVRGRRTLRARETYEPPPPASGYPESTLPDWILDVQGTGDLAVNDAAAGRLEAAMIHADLEAARDRLLRKLHKVQARTRRKIQSLQIEVLKAAGAEEVRRQGELLKSQLHRMHRGQASLEVMDYFEDPPGPRVIPLDPVKTPRGNLEAIFKRYRKLRSGQVKTVQVLESVGKNLERMNALEERIRSASSHEEVEDLEAEAIRKRLIPRPQPPPRSRGSGKAEEIPREPLTFRSLDGLPVLVGRSDAENVTLTFRLARGHDLWLHVRDHPGSHVVVRVPRGKSCPPETLLDAAHLAVHFSKIRGATKATVTHTPRKFVNRLKNAPPGKVSLSRSSSLDLRLEAERLKRLLGSLA